MTDSHAESAAAPVGCGAPPAAVACAPQQGPACGANFQWLALVPCCRTAGVPLRGERVTVSEYKPNDEFVGVETPRKLSRWVDDSSDEEEEQQQKPAAVAARPASPPATPEALRDLGGGW